MQNKSYRISISFQIFVFLIIIAFIPVAIMMALNTYEKQQLTMLENSNVQQGRLVASALVSQEPQELDQLFAKNILVNMNGRFDSRIRILDDTGQLIADSSNLDYLPPVQEEKDSETNEYVENPQTEKSETFVYRLFAFPIRVYRKYFQPPRRSFGSADFYQNKKIYDGSEVKAALAGRYGAETRFSTGGQVSVTLYSAIPVQKEEQVIGVVLVSRSTYRILQNLYELRLDLGKVFLRSLIVVFIIALFLVLRIVQPIKKLSKQAESCADKKGQILFTKFVENKRLDEIGQLSRAFTNLIERLNKRIKFSQAFSSDISHEFKNPLTAIRSSAELLGEQNLTDGQREELSAAIVDEVSHLQNLLTEVRNISKIDAGVLVSQNDDSENPEEAQNIPVNLFIKNLVGRINKNYKDCQVEVSSNQEEINLPVSPEYLEIIASNLIDNACSFGTKVFVKASIETQKKNQHVFTLTVEDNGPGLSEEQISKIFNRFYSERDEEQKSKHTGLGLSLVKAVTDALEGEILVSNSQNLGGAKFTFLLKI